jgi:uncharacterized protein YrrD
MATQPKIMRQSDLLNQLVIDRTTMEEIGRVEVLWMYPPAHKVLGFVCKSGLLGAKKFAFNLAQIHTFGSNSILVNSGAQETDGDKVSQLETLVGCEVWSDAGSKLGKITDCLFNLQTGVISDYLFTPGGLAVMTEGVYKLPPSTILSIGRKRVLVSEVTARSCSPYREGIKQKLSKVGEVLKEDYTEVTQELQFLSRQAQETTGQATQRARSLADQARARAKTLGQRVKAGTQTLIEQVKEQTHTLAEQVKEQAHVLQEQLELVEDPQPEPDLEIPDSILEEDWDIETPPPSATTPHLETLDGEAVTDVLTNHASEVFTDDALVGSGVDPAVTPATLPTEPQSSKPLEEDDEPWL